MRKLILAGLSLFILAAAGSVLAETVPPSLTSFAKRFYAPASEAMQTYADATGNTQAMERVRAALDRQRVRSWADQPVVVDGLGQQLADYFDMDLQNEEDREFLEDFLNADEKDRRHMLSEEKDLKSDSEIQDGMNKLSEAVLGLSQEPVRRVVETKPGETLEMLWRPDNRDFLMKLSNDGSSGDEEFETTFVAETPYTINPETGNVESGFDVSETPMSHMGADDLEALRASLFGDWEDQKGNIWTFSPMDGDVDTGTIKRSNAEIDEEIAALQGRIENIQNAKEFVWLDEDSGEIIRQERFRRLNEPWKYQGEQMTAENAEEQIASIQEQIAALENEKAGAELDPVERYDPIGFESASNAHPIRIQTSVGPNCSYSWDSASFDGRRIRARRTHAELCTVNEALPMEIRRKLLSEGWNPPHWVELTASRDPHTGALTITGDNWGLKVFYQPWFMEIEKIYDPNITSRVTMSRPGEEMNIASSAPERATP